MKYSPVTNFINGEQVSGDGQILEVFSPVNGEVISEVPLSSAVVVDKAVDAAREAFPDWSTLTLKERVQIFFRYRQLLEKYRNELTALVSEENGKTSAEAAAEVDKSIELTEFATSLPQLCVGEIEVVSRGVECRSERHPLGVVASISPFNFPNMVPNWTIPNALALGNTMILKPSEQVPLSANRITEILVEAGLPKGVLNVVHGAQTAVEAICDHPGIDAVSFVGSTKVAKIVYKRATSNLKLALCLGGAKNHLIVLPDANEEMTASDVAASMTGCAGQRCMAASAMVAVGKVNAIIDRLCEETKKIVPGKNLGAIISKQAKERIEGYITEAEAQGAKILVDGRGTTVEGRENGFYVGPTVIDFVTPDMKIAKEEVFGPVLAILRTSTLDEAIEIENNSAYGNAASVFTQSGGLAKYVVEHASAGMIGVNIGVPVPREPFSFGGWNESKFGTGDITGKSSIEFWTKPKKTTTKWNPEAKTNWMS
ncbi:MAG: methylmalonate-semialdehyde dehydrogenase (CoA acylating) [Candidatus Marinimicrobia bacterium]|jgi:malonate-semialdehyde dehydrogenase (acetylating)/methylmalonate-semialdehyde dehydrogenase|nr:methylmalonate-semialdehyde dehydrogenase (CoA acylating) [Candidatus Neomarinimicrobiota bacterium]